MALVDKKLSVFRTKKFSYKNYLTYLWTSYNVYILCLHLICPRFMLTNAAATTTINSTYMTTTTSTTSSSSLLSEVDPTINVQNYINNEIPKDFGMDSNEHFLIIKLPEKNAIKIITVNKKNRVNDDDIKKPLSVFNQLPLIITPTLSLTDCDQLNPALSVLYKHNNSIVFSLNNSFINQQIIMENNNNNNNNFNHNNAITAPVILYLCYFDHPIGKLRHMGLQSKFKILSNDRRIKRQSEFGTVTHMDKKDDVDIQESQQPPQQKIVKENTESNKIQIDGFRIEHSDKDPSFSDEGVPQFLVGSMATLRLFGTGLSDSLLITFTEEHQLYGGSCLLPRAGHFRIKKGSVHEGNTTALVEISVPETKSNLYFCIRIANESVTSAFANVTTPFTHQGTNEWLRIGSYKQLLPLWASLIIITTCLMFSALFSGLNLGLMSLDRTELKILKNTGTPNERKYASKIQPVRDHGNFLLCSILLGNVLVNSTFTIILDGLTSGLIAVVCSTLLIVVFGEITPQAVCSRHGLAVGANTIVVTKLIMLITFPLAYPVSKILDFLLGEEIGNVYNRERLKELVRVTTDVNDLDKDEVNIISGALELRKKTVNDVMTHIDDAFMLSYDSILDFETVSEIMKSGFSRIPVFQNDRKNVLTLLFIKDLALVDPDDNTPLRTLCEFYQNSCHFVFEDVTLDIMFRQFKEGHKGHMAFVHRVNNEGDGDPFYETIGLITLEDVIEELIQAEIMDETDVYTDNRKKVRRIRSNKKQDFTVFAERRDNHRIHVSPQLILATFQYLSTSVDAFKPDMVSETILRRLLNQDIMHHIKYKGKDKNDPNMIIYQQGKPVDFFVLVLEGRVEVTVGKENLLFESGPFTFFGTQALSQSIVVVDSPQQIKGSLQSLNMDALLRHTFVPDFSVKAITDVFYITVKRSLYLAAKRATLMERARTSGDTTSNSEPMDEEVEKLLHSLDEDDRSITARNNNITPKPSSKPSSDAPSPIFMEPANGPNTVILQPGGQVIFPASANIVNRPQGRSHSIPLPYQINKSDDIESPLLKRTKPPSS